MRNLLSWPYTSRYHDVCPTLNIFRIVNNNPKKRKISESPQSASVNCGYVANYGGGATGYPLQNSHVQSQQQQQQPLQQQQQQNCAGSPNAQPPPPMTPLNTCLNLPINTIKQEPGTCYLSM